MTAWTMNWEPLNEKANEADVVISSRVRLARNIKGYRYVHNATDEVLESLLATSRDSVCSAVGDGALWLRVDQLPQLERQLLLERHLISIDLASPHNNNPRAVCFEPQGFDSVMVNEEDHLRIQSMCLGLDLSKVHERTTQMAQQLARMLPFSFHERFGYLTACPSNVGTGIRAGVMLHLPALALSGEIRKVKRATRDMGLVVRGVHGEGSEWMGDLFQLSNQQTLGRSEQEVIDDLARNVIPTVIQYERKAREVLMRDCPMRVRDKVARAEALMMSAMLVSDSEAMQWLSHLRLGALVGVLDTSLSEACMQLMVQVQPAHLSGLLGRPLGVGEALRFRADMLREVWSQHK